MIVLVGGEKGGSGKSTIAVNLAIEAMIQGAKTLLVDCDVQATAKKWIDRRGDLDAPAVACMSAETMPEKLANIVDQYDVVIIDVAGRDSEELRLPLVFVDIAIFPVRPTILDIETGETIDNLFAKYKEIMKRLDKALFVISQAPATAKRSSVIEEARQNLKSYKNLNIANTVIYQRTAYEKAAATGLCVSEIRPADKKASQEILELLKEISE